MLSFFNAAGEKLEFVWAKQGRVNIASALAVTTSLKNVFGEDRFKTGA
jgi:hypothetical protein